LCPSNKSPPSAFKISSTRAITCAPLGFLASRVCPRTDLGVLLTLDRSAGRLISYWMPIGENMKKQKADLLQGTLELLVLRLLRSGRLNGWEIMQRLQLLSEEVLSVTPGALYPALHRLEERGMISAVWGPSENNRKAKFYELTAEGRKQLAAARKDWERFTGAVALILRDA